MDRNELKRHLDEILAVNEIQDYCPNGLQVQGKKEIQTIITGVTASLALIEKAIEMKADAIIVHHGYFWKNESYPITGMKYQRISQLIKHDINLFAYHLPLDIHPSCGNNAQLAKRLDLKVLGPFDTNTHPSYGIICQSTAISTDQLASNIEKVLDRAPLVVGPDKEQISKIALCTGGAQDFIEQAFHAGAEVYISGEISERTTHIANELGITYIAAGHHATERYGINALGEHLAKQFKIDHHFIDINNPV
nr:Nif3-like dinuclear metal center hexameric protein [Facilibium subflavum]